MIKNFKKMLLKDCHCGILFEAEKNKYFMRRPRGKVLLLRIVCKKTESDMA